MENTLFADCAIDVFAFTLRAYAPGERLFGTSDAADAAYLILFGRAIVERDEARAALVFELAGEGDVVGLASALGLARYRETATCTRFTVVAVVPRAHLRVLISFEPRIALNVARIMYERLERVRSRLAAPRRD